MIGHRIEPITQLADYQCEYIYTAKRFEQEQWSAKLAEAYCHHMESSLSDPEMERAICRGLIQIVEGCDLYSLNQVLHAGAPNRFSSGPLESPDGYYGQWTQTLMLLLVTVEVDKLPGYREWLNANDRAAA